MALLAGGVAADEEVRFATEIRPLLDKYCLKCHSTEEQKGDLDLERFDSLAAVRQDPAVWELVEEQLDLGEMPPAKKPQLSPEQKEELHGWVRGTLGEMARAQAGDPGPVVLRRLSNSEYTWSLRDLTGVPSLDPAREFPVDGAAGEGFTNVGAALVMSPALVTKYLDAAKEVASHAVLLPDGIGFSASTTPRDWTEERLAGIRAIYSRYAVPGEGMSVNLQGLQFKIDDTGVLPLEKYLEATLAERDVLNTGAKSVQQVASERGLSAKYLGTLWRAMKDETPSFPLDPLREQWRAAAPGGAPALVSSIQQWQRPLWRFYPIGHIGKRNGPKSWQVPMPPMDAARAMGVAIPEDEDGKQRLAGGIEAFRNVFPAALCYSKIVPVDEVVTLRLFYREDDQLRRLMLDEAETAELDRLWKEMEFVSLSPLKLVDAFEQLSQYVTQGGDSKEFEPLREPVMQEAARFRSDLAAAEPRQLEAIIAFAGKAWRRPLAENEQTKLRSLYQELRTDELDHEEAIRLTLARVLTAPAFLYKPENPGPGTEAKPVGDFEMATRLSYFLWSSTPDAGLLELAAAGKLSDPEVLVAQARRMTGDARVRRLAVEFGCQWLHTRDFDQLDEKSERTFPEFAAIRGALNEEPIHFFTDLFQRDGSLLDLLNANHTFVNGALANYYGLPGVTGDEWRRVEGVREKGRGGVLGFGATLAKQSGASRTSPILRGNWICETLLGEKLPPPPKDVPALPEEAPAGLSERELTSRHSTDPSCARCHVRMDPFGFSLEHYDAIGRWRATDLAGKPVDARAKTADGSDFTGIDGLRDYLLTQRRHDFVRQFCRKLLGYSLGRGVRLSDAPLLDEMREALSANDHRIGVVIEKIVRSPQFREIRGREHPTDSHTATR